MASLPAAVGILMANLLFLPSAAAPAASAKPPAAPPAPPNITSIMSKNGCGTFAGLLSATADAASSYQSSADGGITAFCPSDAAVAAFLPKFKNLSADAKLSLLLYFAVPVYFSLQSLKSNNGVMNTLATDGASKNFNFTVQNEGDAVTIKTAAASPARVVASVYDSDPISVLKIDNILLPEELFHPAESPTPATAPAEAPTPAKKGKKKDVPPPADGPAADDTSKPADAKKTKKNASVAAATASEFSWLGTVAASVYILAL